MDVQLIWKQKHIETCVSREPTNNDAYIHWNSFAIIQWKRSTLESLIYRAHVVCSAKPLLGSELKYLRSIFHKFNGYLYWFITKIKRLLRKTNGY